MTHEAEAEAGAEAGVEIEKLCLFVYQELLLVTYAEE
jgi:hypothetical protein